VILGDASVESGKQAHWCRIVADPAMSGSLLHRRLVKLKEK
jgi:hypothetical protein